MGNDYYPQLVYGFDVVDFVACDEYLTQGGCYPDSYRHRYNDHTYGMSVNVDDLAAGTLPENVKLLGELMEEHFGVVCSVRSVLAGDVCQHCDVKNVSLRTMFMNLKPELSNKELLRRFNDVCSQVKGNESPVNMKEFNEGDEREAKRSKSNWTTKIKTQLSQSQVFALYSQFSE
jgi:hypothetical protein